LLGYGWKDEGMNNLLLDWLDSFAKNRLVLLHDGEHIAADLFRNTHCPLSYQHRELHDSGKLKVIRKWLCDCSAAEIVAELRA
jgi:hypothetical protein